MSKFERSATKWHRKVYRDYNKRLNVEHGCDRTTIPHSVDNNVPDYETPTYATQQNRWENRPKVDNFAPEWAQPQAWCKKCSAKYLKNVRTYECECE